MQKRKPLSQIQNETIRFPMPGCPAYQIFISYAHVDNQAEAHDLDGWVTLVSPSALGPERALLFADLQEEKRREALEWDPAFVAATLRRSPFGLVEVLR